MFCDRFIQQKCTLIENGMQCWQRQGRFRASMCAAVWCVCVPSWYFQLSVFRHYHSFMHAGDGGTHPLSFSPSHERMKRNERRSSSSTTDHGNGFNFTPSQFGSVLLELYSRPHSEEWIAGKLLEMEIIDHNSWGTCKMQAANEIFRLRMAAAMRVVWL